MRRQSWIALVLIACVIAGFAVYESPEAMIERLGGTVGKNYYGPDWVWPRLQKLPGGEALLNQLSSPVSVNANGTALRDEDLQRLIGWNRLEFLSLRRTKVTDAGLRTISEIRGLQGLFLTETAVTDEGLAHFAGMPELLALELSKTRVTDDGIRVLGGLRKLQHLELAGTEVSGEGLAAIGALNTLENLRLERSRITDDGLRHLWGPKLLALCLDETEITDAGVENLVEAPALVVLELSGTRVTDAALASLARFPQLQRVVVWKTEMTPEGVSRFREQYPGIDVEGPE